MLALRWHGQLDIRLDTVSVPPLAHPTDVLLAVEACGVCGTDIEEWREGPIAIPAGRARPLTLGHEFCGRVVSVGSEAPFHPGQLVAVEVNIACGTCAACNNGRTDKCSSIIALGLQTDGGLAEYVVVPAAACIAVDNSVDSRVLALAEPLAVGVHAVSRVKIRENADIAVFGAGAVGILLALLLRSQGRVVVIVESSATRRDLARNLGFEVKNSRSPELENSLAHFDVCFEATGNPDALRAALKVTRQGGNIVLLGVSTHDLGISSWSLVEGEVSLISSKSHTMQDFAEAVQRLVSGQIDVATLPIGEFLLRDAIAAFQGAASHPDAYLKRMMVAPKAGSHE